MVEQIKPRDGSLVLLLSRSSLTAIHRPKKGMYSCPFSCAVPLNIAAEFSLAGRPENHEDRPTTEANVRTGGA